VKGHGAYVTAATIGPGVSEPLPFPVEDVCFHPFASVICIQPVDTIQNCIVRACQMQELFFRWFFAREILSSIRFMTDSHSGMPRFAELLKLLNLSAPNLA
jgi:hypothetical protein